MFLSWGKVLVKLQELSWALVCWRALIWALFTSMVFWLPQKLPLALMQLKVWHLRLSLSLSPWLLCFPAPASKWAEEQIYIALGNHGTVPWGNWLLLWNFPLLSKSPLWGALFKEQMQLINSYLEALISSLTGKWKIISKQDMVL